MWRVGELLLHAIRFASEFTERPTPIEMTIEWSGLKGRELTNTSTSNRYHLHGDYQCREEVVRSALRLNDASTIGPSLSELVDRLTRPLYEAFDFFQLSKEIRDAELNRLRNRR